MIKIAASIGILLTFFQFSLEAIELDSTSLTAPVLNEIIVSSSKNERRLNDIATSVSLISTSEIKKWNLTSIKDISAAVPNLFFPDYGSKLTSPVYIRGIGSKINAPSIGLYVDGIPYFEKSVFDFEFNDVERIEVLRGPQGTLYGRNTMGGIIQIFTKNPLQNKGGKISITGGNYGKREVSASYYGKILPTLGYSVAGKYNHLDGYFTNLHTGKTADKLDAWNGIGKLIWSASNSLNFSVNLQYDQLNQNGYPYARIDSSGTIGAVNYDSVSSYKRNLFSGAFVINKSFDNVLLKSVTSLQTLSDLQSIDQDFSVLPTYFVTQEQTQRLLTEEFVVRSEKDQKYEWLFGLFAFDQTAVNHLKVNTILKDYNTPSQGWALFHQSTLKDVLLPGLSLTAGVRFDYEKGSQDYLYRKPVSGILKTITDTLTRIESTQWSPMVSAQYRFNASNMIYTSLTKGYKTGGFNTSFVTQAETTFEPEYSWNYEIGSKYGFFNNRLAGEFALFYTDWKNQQISQPVLSGVGSMLRNAGQSYSAGFEFALQATITNQWNANLCYGFTKAKFIDYTSGTSNYSNNYIPYIPRHTLMVGSDYTLPLSGLYFEKAIVSCQYIETGTLFWNDANTASQTTYGTVNGKISLVQKHFMFDLWVKNAAATDYAAFYFEMSSKPYGQKGKPRTLGATLTVFIP
jgi:iron complex outermembrane recepter protein